MHTNPDDLQPAGHLTDLERRLSAWRPSPGALDRDRMLYESGRAAALADRDNSLRAWRLAAAALLIASTALTGLLAHDRTQLARDRALLAAEQAHRLELEARFAARGPSRIPDPSLMVPANGPPPLDTYLALTARLAQAGDMPWRDLDREPARAEPPAPPPDAPPRPVPLRPADVQQLLEL